MTFILRYCLEPKRIISATVLDSRAIIPAIAGQSGFIAKAYVDAQIGLLSDNVLPYKIETEDGNMAGYVLLQVDNNGSFLANLSQQFRPNFQTVINDINQAIRNFIINGSYKPDFLT